MQARNFGNPTCAMSKYFLKTKWTNLKNKQTKKCMCYGQTGQSDKYLLNFEEKPNLDFQGIDIKV